MNAAAAILLLLLALLCVCRYAFHDDKLPRWFAEDERRHMRPLPQVRLATYLQHVLPDVWL
jgi:hypothetical protein